MAKEKSTAKKGRKKQNRDTAELHPILGYLGSAGEPVALADDSKLQDTELGGIHAVDIMVFRTEPREYSGPPHQYLETFDTPPSLKLLRDRFGGGKYLIRVYADGRYQKGAATVVIAGPPKPVKIEQDLKDITPGVTGTGDKVSDVALALIDRMRTEIIEAIKLTGGDGQPKATGLDAGSLSELIDMANRKMIENRVLSSLLPGQQPTTAPESSNISDLLKLGLEIFRAGAEFGPHETEGSSGMMELLKPLLQRIMTPAPAQAPKPVVMPMPDADPLVEPQNVEQQRADIERQSIESRESEMREKLKSAVRLMLTAIEADTDYTPEQICEFVKRKITPAEIALIGDKLTFDNVFALMESDPEEQICLNDNKEVVTLILRLLSGQENGVSE